MYCGENIFELSMTVPGICTVADTVPGICTVADSFVCVCQFGDERGSVTLTLLSAMTSTDDSRGRFISVHRTTSQQQLVLRPPQQALLASVSTAAQ